MATTPPPVGPSDLYAAFCGNIDQAAGQKIVNGLAIAMGAKVKHVHLLFQTAGGYVGDGVFLYNFFRTVPIEISLYNVGQVSSIGVIAYLGAKHRIASKSSSFMLHRSTNSPQFATAAKLGHIASSLILDDERTEAIVREHVQFPPEMWTVINGHELYISGEDAVKYGVADSIGEFVPPGGTQVFNILG